MATPTQKRLIQKRLTDIRKAKNTSWSKRFKWTGFSGKTLWDWLNLLGVFLIPIVVVGATIGFGWWQVHLADVAHQQDQQSANLQHKEDQASVLDQQRAAILQTYIDNIQDLLLNHHLLVSKPTDDVAILARARTLTALQGLDTGRKGSLLIFLHEAELIGYQGIEWQGTEASHYILIKRKAIISLNGVNLSGTILTGFNLSGINLSDVSYGGCGIGSISRVGQSGGTAVFANLSGADLSGANLSGANLSGTNLGM